jgi:hypothetical protein
MIMKMKVKSVLKSRMRLFGWALLLALPVVLVTSCSKDDDEKGDNYANAIAGTYEGTLTSSEGISFGTPTVTIEATGVNAVVIKTAIVIPADVSPTQSDFSLPVECPAAVTLENGNYKVSGAMTVPIPAMNVSVQIDGTITSGTEQTATLTIAPSLSGAPLGLFNYIGTKSVK